MKKFSILRKPMVIVAVAALWLLPAASPVSLSAPATTPATELHADVITYSAKTGVMTARGGVRMTQGDTVLTGNEGEYNTRAKQAVVSGNVKIVKQTSTLTAEQVQSLDDMRQFIATGNALLVHPSGTAGGPRLEYYPQREFARLSGGARLVSKDAVVTAAAAEAFFREDRVTADGNVRIVSDSRNLDAVADHAVYYGLNGKNGRAELTGNVRAVQDGAVLTGNVVTLYLDDSAMDSTGRPTLVITPKKRMENQ